MEFHIELNWWWKNTDQHQLIDPLMLKLLAVIDSSGSLQQASGQCQVSYRHAWGLMEKWQDLIGSALIIKQRGRGTALSQAGRFLLNAHQQLNARLSPELANQATELSQQLMAIQTRHYPQRLRLYASHGLAVSALREQLTTQQIAMDLHFHGSLESLQALAADYCDIAGFHIPIGRLGQQIAPQYLNLMDSENLSLIYLVRRQQGLMMPAGNPRNIQSIDDLSGTDLGFINRQRGSGTRLLLDQLVQDREIDAGTIKGYAQEEFTHMAVAAMVASGAADCGFGIAAVADKFALDFLPLCEEHYCLAIPKRRLQAEAVQALLQILDTEQWRQSLAGLRGYDLSQSGQPVSFKQVFGE